MSFQAKFQRVIYGGHRGILVLSAPAHKCPSYVKVSSFFNGPFMWKGLVGALCKKTSNSFNYSRYAKSRHLFEEFNDAAWKAVLDYIYKFLGRKHAQTRYLAVCLAAQLVVDYPDSFGRLLLGSSLDRFFELSIGLNRNFLPGPAKAALKLKEKALALLASWNADHASTYSAVSRLFDVIFNQLKLHSLEDAAYFTIKDVEDRELENLRKRRVFLQAAIRRIDSLKPDIRENIAGIRKFIKQFKAKISEVVPYGDSSRVKKSQSLDALCSDHGIVCTSYKLDLTIPLDFTEKLSITTPQREALGILLGQLESVHRPKVLFWLDQVECSQYEETKEKCERFLAHLTPIRRSLDKLAYQCGLLNVVSLKAMENDERFEEISVEPSIDLASAAECASNLSPERQALLSEAPIVPFDTDLEYWGREKEYSNLQIQDPGVGMHRFWASSSADKETPASSSTFIKRAVLANSLGLSGSNQSAVQALWKPEEVSKTTRPRGRSSKARLDTIIAKRKSQS